jgi:hypothetical protein
MATWNRRQIGSVVKKSEDKQRFASVKEFSVKITEDINLKAGEYLNLENKAFKLASLEAGREKMSLENYEKALERINKMPDYVFFEIVKITKES